MSYISKVNLKYQLQQMGIRVEGNYIRKSDVEKKISSEVSSKKATFLEVSATQLRHVGVVSSIRVKFKLNNEAYKKLENSLLAQYKKEVDPDDDDYADDIERMKKKLELAKEYLKEELRDAKKKILDDIENLSKKGVFYLKSDKFKKCYEVYLNDQECSFDKQEEIDHYIPAWNDGDWEENVEFQGEGTDTMDYRAKKRFIKISNSNPI